MATHQTVEEHDDSQILAGILIMALAMVTLPAMDAIAKHLTDTLSPILIAWGRFAFQMAIIVPLAIMVHGVRSLWPANPCLHFWRGLVMGLSTMAFFTGLVGIPLADAVAIVYIFPLVVTVLSAVFLGENVGIWRWAAVVVGVIGVIVVMKPGGEGLFSIYSVLVAFAASLFAVYLVLTRMLATDPPLVMHGIAAAVAVVFMSIVLLGGTLADVGWMKATLPTLEEWALLAVVGVFSTVTHYMVILAFKRAPASTLAPVGYVEIASATVIGYIFFDEFPGHVTWIGVAIIVFSGLLVWLRERRAASVR